MTADLASKIAPEIALRQHLVKGHKWPKLPKAKFGHTALIVLHAEGHSHQGDLRHVYSVTL